MKNVLDHPGAFAAFKNLFRSGDASRRYVDTFLRPRPGDRVLDIGCGVADILAALPEVEYHGFDSNADYIRIARARFKDRGRFAVQAVGDDFDAQYRGFHLALASGVLHHLNDDEALALLGLAHAALLPGGRLVTLDGCRAPGQGWLTSLMLNMDRGRFVRTEEAYVSLASRVFSRVTTHFRTNLIRFPYPHLVMECER